MVWLLAFQFAGRTWYLSSVECAPEDADGTPIPHLPTITAASFDEALNLGGGDTGPCTANVTFHLALEQDRDLWHMVLAGAQLEQALGEVSVWTPGTGYDERIILVRAPFVPAGVPMPGLPVSGDFVDIVAVSVADWPPASAAVTAETWPDAPDTDDANNQATTYPFVFGSPGQFTYSTTTTTYTGNVAGSQVVLVDTTAAAQVGLICGAPVAAATVHIITAGAPYGGADFAVVPAYDGLGRLVSTVDLSSKDGVWTLDGTVAMYVTDWAEGGIGKATSDGPLRGLGDACLLLLLHRYSEQGPERVDVGTWGTLAPLLNSWRVDFVIDERADPMEKVADLLTICPALWVLGGPRGLRPVFLADCPAEQRRSLKEGRELNWIEQELTFSDIQVCNDCTASFAVQVSTDKARGTVTCDETTSPEAAASQTRPWGRRSDSVEVPTFDRGTAGASAREQIRMRWTRPLVLDYEVTLEVGATLQLGQPVLLTDEDRGLDSRAMWVIGRELPEDLTTCRVSFVGWW